MRGKLFAAAMALTIFLAIAPGVYAGTRVITDMKGKKIEVETPLKRVALFGGPTGQWMYVMGVRDRIVAVSKQLPVSELVLLKDPSVKKLPAPRGMSGDLNVEEMIAANPQLVIAGDLDGSIIEKKTKFKVAYLESGMGGGYDIVRAEARFYGDVFDAKDRAERYVAYLDRVLAFLKDRVGGIPETERKTVFHGYGPSHLVTLGGDTFLRDRIEAAGLINAARDISTAGQKEGMHMGLGEVSMERVLGWDPDMLVVDYPPSGVYSDPRWQALKAVKTKQVLRQPMGVFIWDRPTPEAAVLHPLWLAKHAYPDKMADVDMTVEVKRFYSEIMGFNLTDEEAEKILAAGFIIKFGPVERPRGN